MIRRGRGASINRGLADGDLRGRHEAGDLLGRVVAAAGEDGGEDGGQGVLRVLDEAVGAPGDVLVGADEDDAVLLDLTDAGLSERFGKTPSMALGTYELSPLENCTLHSLLVNGGRYIRPYGVRYVKDYNGNVVWNNEEEVTGAVREKRDRFGKIIDPAACAVTVSMLKGVFEEGGTAAHVMKSRKFTFPVSGKTRTSSNYSDAWFVGYTSDMVTAVWVGNKKGAISLGEGRAGGVLSAGIWGAYAAGIYRDFQPGAFIVPEDGLTRQTICLDSGLVPHEPGLCPRVAIDELFISGTEPGEYCNLHTRPAEAEKR